MKEQSTYSKEQWLEELSIYIKDIAEQKNTPSTRSDWIHDLLIFLTPGST